MADLITSHPWRPVTTGRAVLGVPVAKRPCVYAGCGRPRSEHARSAREKP